MAPVVTLRPVVWLESVSWRVAIRCRRDLAGCNSVRPFGILAQGYARAALLYDLYNAERPMNEYGHWKSSEKVPSPLGTAQNKLIWFPSMASIAPET